MLKNHQQIKTEPRHKRLAIITGQYQLKVSKGSLKFIPKKLVTKVGAIITRLMIASFFITTFRLLEATELKASITPKRMFE